MFLRKIRILLVRGWDNRLYAPNPELGIINDKTNSSHIGLLLILPTLLAPARRGENGFLYRSMSLNDCP